MFRSNRYDRKLRHKKKMKELWQNTCSWSDKYWQPLQLSGKHQVLKDKNDDKLSTHCKRIIHNEEDITLPKNSEYKKFTDSWFYD